MLNFDNFKRICIFSLIGSLIVSALVAVVTILFGEFNEVTSKVFWTLSMVVVHSLISLAFIWDREKQNNSDRLSFFINTVFVIIIASFMSSVFKTWEIVSWETFWNFYETYFVFAFASLHIDVLSKALYKKNYIDKIIYANFVFIAIIVLMLQPVIYAENLISDGFYKLLGAAGIIDGTLSVLTIIFYRLYMHKNPQNINSDGTRSNGMNIWIWSVVALYFLTILYFVSGLVKL